MVRWMKAPNKGDQSDRTKELEKEVDFLRKDRDATQRRLDKALAANERLRKALEEALRSLCLLQPPRTRPPSAANFRCLGGGTGTIRTRSPFDGSASQQGDGYLARARCPGVGPWVWPPDEPQRSVSGAHAVGPEGSPHL